MSGEKKVVIIAGPNTPLVIVRDGKRVEECVTDTDDLREGECVPQSKQ